MIYHWRIYLWFLCGTHSHQQSFSLIQEKQLEIYFAKETLFWLIDQQTLRLLTKMDKISLLCLLKTFRVSYYYYIIHHVKQHCSCCLPFTRTKTAKKTFIILIINLLDEDNIALRQFFLIISKTKWADITLFSCVFASQNKKKIT